MAYAKEIEHQPGCTETGVKFYQHRGIPMVRCKRCRRFAEDVGDYEGQRVAQTAAARSAATAALHIPKPGPVDPKPRTRSDLNVLPMLGQSRVDGAAWARANGVTYYRADHLGNLERKS